MNLNVNLQFDGNTPLSLAASFGHSKIIQLFIDKGANINEKNKVSSNKIILKD